MADDKHVVKTLDLFRHSDKDKSGNHISYDGLDLAYNAGEVYEPADVNYAFHGPLIRTSETLIAMMGGNEGFKHTIIKDPVDGLGSDELFAEMITDQVRAAIKDGKSNMDAVLENTDDETMARFINDSRDALTNMFSQMEDGSLGVGVFHDPTIPILAHSLEMEGVRSLNTMERIRFCLYDDGSIEASFPDDV